MAIGSDPRGCAIHPVILTVSALGGALIWISTPTVLRWLCLTVDALISKGL